MNARQHAARARALISLCGGVGEAADHSRVSAARLSHYQNPEKTDTMPADVICDLEAYCGKPIYSQALFGARQCGGAEDLLLAINTLDDAAGALRSDLVKALHPHSPGGRDLAPVEQDRLAKRLSSVGLAMIEASAAFSATAKPVMEVAE